MTLRQIIQIDEDLCNGCGICVPNCHEGALQIIDGKARLISDLFCDGLGACIGHCPEGAIEIIEREAEAYNEMAVIESMVSKGKNTITAHLDHLLDHNEIVFFNEGFEYLQQHHPELIDSKFFHPNITTMTHHDHEGFQGCPGSRVIEFNIDQKQVEAAAASAPVKSELRQWPVQLHLLNPAAHYFKGADVVLASDCSGFAMGDFHARYMKGKTVAIACPKLDSNKESYLQKLVAMINDSKINTLNVVIMEVPCCGGLSQMALMARQQSGRNIPIKQTVLSIQGEVLEEDWI